MATSFEASIGLLSSSSGGLRHDRRIASGSSHLPQPMLSYDILEATENSSIRLRRAW